jgi:Ca-activated chloride channel family protein
LEFQEVSGIVEAIGIPVHTIGFEADIAELKRLSGLVEAASIDAVEDDVCYKLASMFNAEM